MAFTTIFLVIPFAYFASILWSFLIYKKIKNKINPAKLIYKILFEFFKVILIVFFTFLFTLIGMLVIGIVGLPILFVIIIIGIIFTVRYLLKNRKKPDVKTYLGLGYNLVLIILIVLIPIYIGIFVVSGIEDITQNNFIVANPDYVEEDLININLRIRNSGKPEEIVTRKFPYTRHVQKIYPDLFNLQIAYHFHSYNISKIKINKYLFIINDKEYNIYEKDFDIFGSVYYKDIDSNRSSDTELSQEEIESYKKTKEMLLIRSKNEVISGIICNYGDLEINADNTDKIIFEYDIDLIMEDGEIHNINKRNELYKEGKPAY
jgi:hypothetical protein